MKYKKILITLLIMVAIVIIGNTKVEAASAEITSPKQTVEVGDSVTITVKFTAAAWNLKVSGNGVSGESYASQTSDLTEVQTVKTFKLDTSKVGTYTITLKGDITDKDGNTHDINKSCAVTVKEKTVVQTPNPEPEKPATTTPSTPTIPSTPTTTEKPKEVEFKTVNETVYATGTVNVRKECSSKSDWLGQLKEGDSLTRIGKSTSKADGHYWSKVTYKGQTSYVISDKLSTEKPVEEEPEEEPVEETPEEPTTTTADEPEQNTETIDEVKGLKTLEIEGLTLSPEFETGTYKYEAVLRENITELKINTETLEENGTAVVAGDTNLQEGENLITIIVYNAKNEPVSTYQIIVNKNTLDLSTTDELLKYGNQAATLKTAIYLIAIALVVIILIAVLIIKSRVQNKQEEIQLEQKNVKEEKQEKFAIEEDKKGKHF